MIILISVWRHFFLDTTLLRIVILFRAGSFGGYLGRPTTRSNRLIYSIRGVLTREESSLPHKKPNPQTLTNLSRILRSSAIDQDGVIRVGREHIACSPADEQCHNHRRESPEWMPQRNHPRSPAIRCAVQARPGYADQYQEARQFRRPRRWPQQAQNHSAGTPPLISIFDFNPLQFGNPRFLKEESKKRGIIRRLELNVILLWICWVKAAIEG